MRPPSSQVFKFSYNKLRVVTGQTLQGLRSLMRLHLDHNQIEFIHPQALQGLTSLRLLHLEGNALRQLHGATFATFSLLDHFRLSNIRHLYLADNRLQTLPAGVLATMPLLETLYLQGNPWACDCHMRWFLDWDARSKGEGGGLPGASGSPHLPAHLPPSLWPEGGTIGAPETGRHPLREVPVHPAGLPWAWASLCTEVAPSPSLELARSLQVCSRDTMSFAPVWRSAWTQSPGCTVSRCRDTCSRGRGLHGPVPRHHHSHTFVPAFQASSGVRRTRPTMAASSAPCATAPASCEDESSTGCRTCPA